MQRLLPLLSLGTVLGAVFVASPAIARSLPVSQGPSADPAAQAPPLVEPSTGFAGCLLHQSPGEILADFQAAVRRGEIPDPAARPRPAALPSHRGTKSAAAGALTHDDILAWEDTQGQIQTIFGSSPGVLPDEAALTAVLVEAANAILATHCDDYDYIAFWMNYPPATWWPGGVAGFNAAIRNETTGLGVFPGAEPDGTYDFHEAYGLAGSQVQSLLFFTNLNDPLVAVNDGTRQLVCHEYAHHWGITLPDLLDGRKLEGEGLVPCAPVGHWNRRVDGQGSAFSIWEWIGSGPAVVGPTTFSGMSFNTDIPGGMYSYLDLYLMGFASPAEVTAGMSELRYMDGSTVCSPGYGGPISDFTVDDVVAAAGPRVPDSSASQKDFRTAWVIIHQPGDAPDAAEKDKLIAILEQQELDWSYSTLGRSTMSHNVDPAVPSVETVRLGTPPNPAAFLPGVTSGPVVGATWDPVIDHAAFQPASVLDFVAVGLTPTDLPSPFGTILCGIAPLLVATAAPGAPFAFPIPNDCGHVGVSLCTQAGALDAGLTIAFANALDITIGTH